MKTDGMFVTHSFDIPCRSKAPIHLVIWGDVHRDAILFGKEEWARFLERAKSLPSAYFLGMGDYLDSTSTSERSCLESSSQHLHDTIKNDLNKLQEAKIEMLAKELKFMKGRLIGLINGNHFYNFSDGTNSDNRLCGKLDCKYLGVTAMIRITFAPPNGKQRKSFDIMAHHGQGGSRQFGGSINRVEQLKEWSVADLYIMGHDHHMGAIFATPLFYLSSQQKGGLEVKAKYPVCARSGSFLRSYEAGKRSYNVDAGKGPRKLGWVEVIITPTILHGHIDLDVKTLV